MKAKNKNAGQNKAKRGKISSPKSERAEQQNKKVDKIPKSSQIKNVNKEKSPDKVRNVNTDKTSSKVMTRNVAMIEGIEITLPTQNPNLINRGK